MIGCSISDILICNAEKFKQRKITVEVDDIPCLFFLSYMIKVSKVSNKIASTLHIYKEVLF